MTIFAKYNPIFFSNFGRQKYDPNIFPRKTQLNLSSILFKKSKRDTLALNSYLRQLALSIFRPIVWQYRPRVLLRPILL